MVLPSPKDMNSHKAKFTTCRKLMTRLIHYLERSSSQYSRLKICRTLILIQMRKLRMVASMKNS